MRKFLTFFLSVLCMACLASALVACGGGKDDEDDGKIDYTVTVSSVGGDTLRNVSVGFYNDSLDRVKSGVTDAKGSLTVRLEPKDYTVRISDLPKGYNLPTTVYRTDAQGSPVEIYLTSSVIDEPLPSNYVYKEGDVMYDFSFTTTKGDTFTLSEMLETKKLVMINFWGIFCGPCKSEFPAMIDAYHSPFATEENPDGTFSDEVAILAVSMDPDDTDAAIESYLKENGFTNATFGWTCSPEFYSHFNTGNSVPASIFIDRYGVFCYMHVGALPEVSDFTKQFDKFCSDDYNQTIDRGDEDEEVQRPLNPYDMPSSEEIAAAVNGEGFNGTYHGELETEDKDYSWPWFVGVDEYGKKYMYNSNVGIQKYSFATVYMNYHAKKGDVLAFDYYADIEDGYDVLTILYNDRQQFNSLTGNTGGWKTHYLDIAKEDGDYEVIFLYRTDERNLASALIEDVVRISNIRLTDEDEMKNAGVSMDIIYDCTTDFDEDNLVWKNYANVGLNQNDGYYHLLDKNGEPNGELVLLSTMTGTHWSNTSLYDYANVDDDADYRPLDFGEDGDYTQFILTYCSYAQLSDYLSYIPVTQELKDALSVIASHLGSGVNENEWLEMCVYFVHYGAGSAPTDPVEGLTHFSALPLHITAGEYTDDNYSSGATDGDLNKIVIKKQPFPRGLYYEFTPEESGVYELRTFGKYEVTGWVVKASDMGPDANRADVEMIADLEPINAGNFTGYAPLEAGVSYFILLDLFQQADPNKMEDPENGIYATFYLSIKNKGDSVTELHLAADPLGYTTDSSSSDMNGDVVIIPFGDFLIGPDGPVMSYKGTESKVFVDLLSDIRSITTSYEPYYDDKGVLQYKPIPFSLADVIEATEGNYIKVPVFDLTGKFVDEDKDGFIDMKELKFEGAQLEYMRGLLEQARKNSGTAENGQAPYGMVELTNELFDILDELVHECTDMRARPSDDGVTPVYVENELLKLCYYYRTYKI